MAAKQSELSGLHAALAEMFLEDIRICREEGIPMSASDKAVIVKFLKDNSITADVDNSEMDKLKDEFADELAARRKARAEAILQQEDDSDELHGIL
jgi:hypothetical protein